MITNSSIRAKLWIVRCARDIGSTKGDSDATTCTPARCTNEHGIFHGKEGENRANFRIRGVILFFYFFVRYDRTIAIANPTSHGTRRIRRLDLCRCDGDLAAATDRRSVSSDSALTVAVTRACVRVSCAFARDLFFDQCREI